MDKLEASINVHFEHSLQGNNVEIDKTCPNQDMINDNKKLTDFCHSGQNTINLDIFRQLSVTLDNFLSMFYHLSHLHSDMFMSIQPLFPCSDFNETLNAPEIFTFMNKKSIIRLKVMARENSTSCDLDIIIKI